MHLLYFVCNVIVILLAPEVSFALRASGWLLPKPRSRLLPLRSVAVPIIQKKSFWQEAMEAQDKGDFIEFASPVTLISDELGNKLYVRPEYRTLWDDINRPGTRTRHLLLGTPGIGKSHFLIFVIWKLAQSEEGRNNGIIYYREQKSTVFYNQSQYDPEDDVPSGLKASILRNNNAWILFDQKEYNIFYEAKSILASSLRGSNFNEYSKRCKRYYLSDWRNGDCDEHGLSGELQGLIKHCFSHLDDDVGKARVGEAVEKFGCIPRHVLENLDVDYQADLVSKINSDSLDKTLNSLRDKRFDDGLTNLLIRPVVNTTTHKLVTFEFSSNYLKNIALTLAEGSFPQKRLIWLKSNEYDPGFASLWGGIFEYAFHNRVVNGMTLPCKIVNNCKAEQEFTAGSLVLPASSRLNFDRNGDITGPGYWVPKSPTNAAVDSVLISKDMSLAYVFQVTKSVTHTLQDTALINLGGNLTALGVGRIQFAVVVPNKQFKEFKWLSLCSKGAGGKWKADKDIPLPKMYVQNQFILGVNLEDLNEERAGVMVPDTTAEADLGAPRKSRGRPRKAQKK